jgi:phosphoribosyl 1,2-cyclic phosphodiesterase
VTSTLHAIPASDDAAVASLAAPPRLWTLGSGSKGNAAVLSHRGRTLMFDCGYELPVLVDRLRLAGLHPWDVDDVVLTHGHRDHVVGAAAGARAYGWRVWGALGTVWRWRALREIDLRPFEPGATIDAGAWRVRTTPVPHDVDDAAAFVAEWAGDGPAVRVGYATDFGRAPAALVDLLRGADALVLESNHDVELLRSGPYPPERQARVGGEHGHLSNARAAAVLRAVAHPGLRHVVLAHISRHNNTHALALAAAHEALAATGFAGLVHAAPQDTVLGPLAVGEAAGDAHAGVHATAAAWGTGVAPPEPLARPALTRSAR